MIQANEPIADARDTLLTLFDKAIVAREADTGHMVSREHALALREYLASGIGTFGDLWTFAHAFCLARPPDDVPVTFDVNPAEFIRALCALLPTSAKSAIATFRADFTGLFHP
jgi:hypothetical protein